MSAAAVLAGAQLVAPLLPSALTVVDGIVRAIHGEDEKRAALEQVADLAVRLGAIELPSAVAGDAFDRAVAARGGITHGVPVTHEVPRFAASRIDPRSLGQVNFEEYSAARGGKNHDGTPTPKWGELGDGVRAGWEAGAAAAVRSVLAASTEKVGT